MNIVELHQRMLARMLETFDVEDRTQTFARGLRLEVAGLQTQLDEALNFPHITILETVDNVMAQASVAAVGGAGSTAEALRADVVRLQKQIADILSTRVATFTCKNS